MRRGYSHLFPLISILLFPWTPSHGQTWSGVLATNRAIDWSQAGIPGGIPTRTTVCATVTAGASTATIQTAVNNCPVGQVVSFGAGSFTLTTSLRVNKGVVLRGQGPNSTTITLSNANILLGLVRVGWDRSPATAAQTAWTGGLTKGSRVLTIASTAGLSAGQTIIIDENNPAWVFTTGVEGPCTSGNSCGRSDNPPRFYGAANRAMGQMTQIVSVDSGTQITIKDPVGYTHTAGRTPQVFYWSNPSSVKYAGVEDMKVNANLNSFAISMSFCDNCWVKNVAVDNLARSGAFFYYSYGSVVRDSYFSSTNAGAPTQYGIETIMSANALIENNILYNVTSPILPESSYGLVIGYNYATNTVPGNLFASFSAHLAHSSFQLLEGNVMDTISYDNSWGSASHSTLFRNRANGKGKNKTNYRVAVKFNAHQHFMNAVANVLGDPTHHTRYRCDNVDTSGTDNHVYDLGYFNACQNGASWLRHRDPKYLFRWGNWDAVTWKANGNTNGVRYCTGSGAGNPACTADERADGDPTFPGLTSPSQTFPASFYRSAKPAWFGSVPWPAIGPDVSCTTNCIANTANHAAMIPAQLCYANTAKNSSGFLTAFDANRCYANDGADSTKPAPPSDLVVN